MSNERSPRGDCPAPMADAMAWMASTGAAWDRRLERLRDAL